ncbi:Uncharacterised protein [Vibrio cholerae]|uniref:Uncharacterized protein n=1 Tax=Vibrio cholerae TaxID=666 RepID=A0A655ZLW3_VIBCL|nr:Uncharacterised protein [Vibrio cholerae]CSC59149.1 Uncharacterised protein [Vibrio cholerae]CSC61076.1 Uncharacterised protein [Vibrio cholerae]CSC75486.1 Uncharacterised protein [Vibrio cholerae]CSD09719.1 Uncharacterised protein [Vibrio cholerae]
MANVDIVTIKLVIAGFLNHTITRSPNRCSYWCHIVSTTVSFNLPGHWMESARIKVRRDATKIERRTQEGLFHRTAILIVIVTCIVIQNRSKG